ncbi:hypothetical protein LTR15_000250 [Elasticomyces elasticus]|nr:hypothetical protein LTR15_000250 [Elasticomyces elasticus]
MEPPETDSTTAEPEQPPRSLYNVQYVEAVKSFNNNKFDECIEAARYTLNDPTLPRYYHVKTLLLIANAEEDWYPAERCRREAEDVYAMAQRLTTPEKEATLATLRILRKDLDAVAASQQREAPSDVDERLSWESSEEEEEQEEEKGKAVGASVTGAEGLAASWKPAEERKAGPKQQAGPGVEVKGSPKTSAAHGGGSSVADSMFSARVATTMPRRTLRSPTLPRMVAEDR